MAKYRLLAGKHIGNDMNGQEQMWDANNNNLIETKDNLDRFNSKRHQLVKFEKLPDDFVIPNNGKAVTATVAVAPPPPISINSANVGNDDYDGMDETELKKYAHQNKFDIKGLKNAEEIRKKIRELEVA